MAEPETGDEGADPLETLRPWPEKMLARLIEPLDEGQYDWVHFPGLKALRDDLLAWSSALAPEGHMSVSTLELKRYSKARQDFVRRLCLLKDEAGRS